MLDAFQKKVEQAAEEYADLVIKIISHAKSADQLTPEIMEKANDGIRMLNHAACTLERISRIQPEKTICDKKSEKRSTFES